MKRERPFANGELYHIYNRGVDKRNVFSDEDDYRYFKYMLEIFNNTLSAENTRRNFKRTNFTEGSRTSFSKPLVKIEQYCLMPNHYHLLLKQLREKGISLFLQKLGTGYTHFFNKKHKRSGVLFQGKTKSKHVGNDPYFQYLKMYINLNPIDLIEPGWKEKGIKNHKKIHQFLLDYPWSSYKNSKENYIRDLSDIEMDSLLEIDKAITK
jgi:putative transposase